MLNGVPHSKQANMFIEVGDDEAVLVVDAFALWVFVCWMRSLLLRKVSPQWKQVVSWEEWLLERRILLLADCKTQKKYN